VKFVLALTLCLFAALLPQSSRADDDAFAAAVRSLNADSYADKIAAAQSLAALGDPRGAAVLAALGDGVLYARPDGSLVMETGGSYSDPVSGAAVAGVNASDLTAVTVNNRLRGILRGLQALLDIASPDPAARLKAVQAVAAQGNPESAELLRKALDHESDATVRKALQSTLAGLDLASPDKDRRLAAIAALAGSTDRGVQGQLQTLLAQEQDPQVKTAAEKALSSIDGKLAAIGLAANLFQGLSLGSVLLLAAIGLAITFGVMGVINMAHGEMIMLGSYTAYVVQEAFRAWLPPAWIDLYLIVALPVAFLFTALVGIALERGLIRFLYGRPLETLLSTFGISLILQQAVRSVFGAPNKEVANPAWMTGGFDLMGGFTVTWNRLIIIVFCLLVLGALAALLRWSAFGLQMRAVAQNRPMAAAMGIRTGRIDAFTFGLGSGIAGIAGVALSQIGNVSPNLGQGYIVDSFMVVVFGGVGSLWGTLVGALSLGAVNKFLEPYAGAMLGKILVLVFIILFIQKRPRGLFALKGRSVEN
jgi:urea transport system permease protein